MGFMFTDAKHIHLAKQGHSLGALYVCLYFPVWVCVCMFISELGMWAYLRGLEACS